MSVTRIEDQYSAYDYVDDHHNKWSIKYLYYNYPGLTPKEAAEKASESLKGCSHCINCKDCSDCTSCECCSNCSNCDVCTDCEDCESCNDCTGCINCIYCGYCKECDNCNDCAYCIDCTICSCCGGCISCSGLGGRFLEQGVASLIYVCSGKPDIVEDKLSYDLYGDKAETSKKLVQEFCLSTRHGLINTMLEVIELHASKYASYRARKAYEHGYKDGYEGS